MVAPAALEVFEKMPIRAGKRDNNAVKNLGVTRALLALLPDTQSPNVYRILNLLAILSRNKENRKPLSKALQHDPENLRVARILYSSKRHGRDKSGIAPDR
jgi:hypothetical protein